MKKWILIPILILLIILLSCQKKNREDLRGLERSQEKEEPFLVVKEVENKILSAIKQLKDGNATDGATLLFEAILLTKLSGYMPEGFEDKILTAKDQFQSGNFGEGVESVSEALLLIKPASEKSDEKDKEKPADVEEAQKEEEIAPIAEIMRSNILSALDEFKKGNAEKGVILILEALQLFSPRTD